MERLTRKISDGSYVANESPNLPGENSYEYNQMIIDRCGKMEEMFNIMKNIIYGDFFETDLFDSELKEKAKELVELNKNFNQPVSQHVYLLEEFSELQKEVMKDQRNKGNVDHIKEEIADVMCALLTYMYDKGIDINQLRDVMIHKFNKGISQVRSGEQ